MTFSQVAMLALLALNVLVTYRMLRHLTVAALTGSFVVAHWLNPIRAKWFRKTYEKMAAAEDPDSENEKLAVHLAEENPECPRGRESLIAGAFNA